jgi:hypothetical protein
MNQETVYCLLDSLIHGITTARGHETENSEFLVAPGIISLKSSQWTRSASEAERRAFEKWEARRRKLSLMLDKLDDLDLRAPRL